MVNVRITRHKNLHKLEDMLQDKNDVTIVKFLWILKEPLVLVAIDNYDVCLEVEKARKDT